jgi:tungstate transport system permease protein
MDLIFNGVIQAFWLLISGDPAVWQVAGFSLTISIMATLISLCVGVPLGAAMALNRFRGRQFLVTLINTGMGSPPVVVGLIVSIMLWRTGPLGVLHLLYTPWAMVIAQFIISLPLVTGFSMAGIQQLDNKLRLQIFALGASRIQMVWLLLRETRLPLLAAVMAGFGAVISEVGASMMVGGNLLAQPGEFFSGTRVLTTATVLEVNKGNFDIAIALSVILIILVYLVNVLLTWVQQRSKTR